ncbi:hypothetical protein, partial [Pseudonocardia sp. Ae505_Ps2]
PRVVPFASVRDKVEACKPGEILIGLDRQRKPFHGSFLADDPHWGFEVGSRRGKSTFLSLSAAQILHQDPAAEATGIDVKRESFKSLFGVPRFHLHNDPADIAAMWNGIRHVKKLMDRRCNERADDPTLEFPFHLLLIDELSQFSAQSMQLWRQIKEKGDPAHPPVWDDIAAIMWQGAAFRVHIVLAGQRIDHQITGGIGLITSLGFRGLAGFRRQNWMRLAGTFPVPRSRPERGRWIYSDGESETWVQNIWATDDEIKQWATTTSHDTATEAAVAGPTEGSGKWEPGTPAAEESTQRGAEWVTGNVDAAAYLGIHPETFRKRRQAHEIPNTQRSGRSPTWTTQSLDEWGAMWEQETSEQPAEVA